MKAARIICFFLLMVGSVLSWACCSWMRELNEPARPSNTTGWKTTRLGDTLIEGIFVLNKGESTDNGRLGIKIMEIYAGKCQATDEPVYPHAKVQFYRVSDGKVICEPTVNVGSAGLHFKEMCGADFEWSVISVNAINSKDNWVFFDLRR